MKLSIDFHDDDTDRAIDLLFAINPSLVDSITLNTKDGSIIMSTVTNIHIKARNDDDEMLIIEGLQGQNVTFGAHIAIAISDLMSVDMMLNTSVFDAIGAPRRRDFFNALASGPHGQGCTCDADTDPIPRALAEAFGVDMSKATFIDLPTNASDDVVEKTLTEGVKDAFRKMREQRKSDD